MKQKTQCQICYCYIYTAKTEYNSCPVALLLGAFLDVVVFEFLVGAND